MICLPLRRVGTFEIPWETVEKDLSRAYRIVEGTLAIHADPRADRCSIVYSALHPDFDEVAAEAPIPRYEYHFDEATGARVWRRVTKG